MYTTECANNLKEKKKKKKKRTKTPENNKSYIEIYNGFFQVKADHDCVKIDRKSSVNEEEFKILIWSQQLKAQ